MSDLAAFLGARFDEGERRAYLLAGTTWTAVGREVFVLADPLPPEPVIRASRPDVAEWAAACNPCAVQRDIALKRAIVALHATQTERVQQHALDEDLAAGKPHWWYEEERSCVICGWFDSDAGGCATVRQLGTGFSDHPEYRQEWAP